MQMREGVRFGDVLLKDSMLSDGLMDAFQQGHMGCTGINRDLSFFLV